MTTFGVSEIAGLLGVHVDTVRRWTDGGQLPCSRDAHGYRVVAGPALAEFFRSRSGRPAPPRVVRVSARNRIRGVVVGVELGEVMAVVEIQAGPHRIKSLMTREAVEDLGLEPGRLVDATVKATDVVVEIGQDR